MKIKIKNFNGELPDYLTVGKEYEVVDYYGIHPDRHPLIIDDRDEVIAVVVNKSSHLNGGSWEIVNE